MKKRSKILAVVLSVVTIFSQTPNTTAVAEEVNHVYENDNSCTTVESEPLDATPNISVDVYTAGPLAATPESDFTWNGNTITKYNGTAANIVIPARAVSIDSSAFKDNDSIETLAFEEESNCLEIGSSAFNGCDSLTAVVLGDRIKDVNSSAFYRASNLASVTLPESLETIGNYAFTDCKLSQITIPSNVTQIGASAFSGNTGLTKVVIKTTKLNSTNKWIFSGCNINDLTLPDNMPSIPTELFYEAGFEAGMEIVLPSTVTSIGGSAFYGASNLKSVFFPLALKEIKSYAFNGCTGIREVTYEGTEALWQGVKIGSNNDPILTPTTYLNKEPIIISFDSQGGSSVDSISTFKGAKITGPAAPVKRHYLFGGWFTDPSCKDGSKFDFNTALESNLTLYASWSRDPDGFKMGEDSNHFANSGSSFFNEGDTCNYNFKDSSVYSMLDSLATTLDKRLLERYVLNSWGGSCYGIASTMGLTYLEMMPLSNISSESTEFYHDLGNPKKDPLLFDAINFYQSGQILDRMYYDTMVANVKSTDGKEKLSDFLKKFVEFTETGSPAIFSYGIGTSGHAVLALFSKKDTSTGNYIIKIYDENTASGQSGIETEKTTEFTVAGDYSWFQYVPVGSTDGLQNNFKYLTIRDVSKYPVFKKNAVSGSAKAAHSGTAQNASSSHAYLDVLLGSDASIENANGQKLQLKDGETTGNMTVYNTKYIDADEASRIIYEVDDSDVFSVTADKLDISVITSDQVLSLSGESIKRADFSMKDHNIEVCGSNYSFNAVLSKDNGSLLSVSGTAETDTEIALEDGKLKLTSDGNIKNVTAEAHDGNTAQTTDVTVDDGEAQAARASGMNPVATLTENNTLYLVKGQTYELGGSGWTTTAKSNISINSKGILTAKKATGSSGAKVTNSTSTYTVVVIEPSVTINGNKSASLVIGDTASVMVKGIPSGTETRYPVAWQSANTAVATVSPNHGVSSTTTAVGKGSTKITAYIGGKAYTCTVSVKDTNAAPAKITGSSADIKLDPMKPVALKYSDFNPKKASWISLDKTHEMSVVQTDRSGNPKTLSNGIVRIDVASGKLTAVGSGSTSIKGTDVNNKNVTLNINIRAIPSNPVSYLLPGKKITLKAPKLNGKKATWSVVSGNGYVSSLNDGVVTSSSSIPTGEKNAYAEIQAVYKPYEEAAGFTYSYKVYVESPALKASGKTEYDLKPGTKTGQYTISLPSNSRYNLSGCYSDIHQGVIWKSSLSSAAYVDENGILRTNKVGSNKTAKLTARVNGVSFTINVSVLSSGS